MWPLVLLLLAQPANPWLEQARARSEALDFAGAIEQLEVARQVPGLSAGQRRELLALLARCRVAQGQRPEAEAAWTELLQADPGYEPDAAATSPKILESFDEAKRRLFPPGWVRLEETGATGGRASFRLIDPWHVVTSVQRFERLDAGPWRASDLERAGPELSFPLLVPAGVRLEWYLEARGGPAVLARSADEAAPHVVFTPSLAEAPVPPAAKRLSPRQVTGWALLGAGVLAAGVGGGLQAAGWSLRVSARDPSHAPGDFAATARAADAQGLAQTQAALGLFIGAGALSLAGLGVLTW